MKNTNIGRRLLSLTAGVVVAGILAYMPSSVHATAWQQDGVIIKGEKGSEATDVREGQQRYGPITSNDTLWAIASEYRPHSSVTQYQTMVAIAQANPRAFVDGNLNRMLDGFYLRIPSLQEIQMINPETARRRVLADQQLKFQQQRLSEAEQQTQMTRAQQQQLLTEARERAEQVIQRVEQQQQQSFSQLQSEVNESMQAVQRVYDENEQIQQRLDALAQRIDELAKGLQQTDELEQQFEQLLQQQQQLLTAQPQQQPSGFTEWLKSPLNLMVLAVLPALLIIAGLYFFLFRRRNTVTDGLEPSAKPVDELDDEAAAQALDRELMEGGQDSSSDGLFDLDGDFDRDDDDLGDDLSALEAELTQTGQTNDDDDDFSIRLDDDEDEDEEEMAASDGELAEDELSDDDTALLPDDDNEQHADAELPRQTPSSNDSADDEADDGESALSQDELDELFAESDDDEPALDLSLDDEDESAPAADNQAKPEATDDDAVVSASEQSEDVVEPETESADDDSLVEAGVDDTDYEDASEADEALAQLGIDEEDDSRSDGDANAEQDLDSLLRESETLESKLREIDAIEKQLPADEEPPETDADSADDEGYVDIDKLMEDADEEGTEEDNYHSSAVEELLNDEELENVGKQDADVDEHASAQLDLARAYIDMGEEDEAKEILQQLLNGDDEALAADAKALLARITT